MKTIAPKGSSEAFLRAHVDHKGQDCLLWPFRRIASGYGLAVIGGVQKHASRWMCELVHGAPPFLRAEAAHACGNAGCVNPEHLRWATGKQNCADKLLHGTHNRGERSGKAKLTAEDVAAIRAAPADLRALMARYGVSKGCISKVRSGQRWGAENGIVWTDPTMIGGRLS